MAPCSTHQVRSETGERGSDGPRTCRQVPWPWLRFDRWPRRSAARLSSARMRSRNLRTGSSGEGTNRGSRPSPDFSLAPAAQRIEVGGRRCDQFLNNVRPNTGKQQGAVRATPTKNQQDSHPVSTYEPGGRRFESCRARDPFPRASGVQRQRAFSRVGVRRVRRPTLRHIAEAIRDIEEYMNEGREALSASRPDACARRSAVVDNLLRPAEPPRVAMRRRRHKTLYALKPLDGKRGAADSDARPRVCCRSS
jgi:hypothetical protein